MKAIFISLLLLGALPVQASERILALTPHVCEIMFAIGADDDVVGAGDFCDYPPAASKLPRVANYAQVYVEAALRLKPTLAISLDPALSGLQALRYAGVRVISSDPQSVAEVFTDIRRLGTLSGHSESAQKLADQLKARLQRLQTQFQGRKTTVFYEIWKQPLMAVGGAGFLQDMLRQAGLKNVFDGVSQEGIRLNPESVVRARPELIIVAGRDAYASERQAYWRVWLPNVQVVSVDANLMHRPGPRIVDALELLMQKVQPEGTVAVPQ